MTSSPSLPQERRLVTAIPGPKSQALQARRTAAVSAGVGATLPIYVHAAAGGVIVDIDGNSLIVLRRALEGFDTRPDFGRIKARVLYVISRTDKLEAVIDATWFDDGDTRTAFLLDSSIKTVRARAADRLAKLAGGSAP
mgnify:CR=1 FL=1